MAGSLLQKDCEEIGLFSTRPSCVSPSIVLLPGLHTYMQVLYLHTLCVSGLLSVEPQELYEHLGKQIVCTSEVF